MHVYLAFSTDYDVIRHARIVLTNSKYTAFITEMTLHIRSRVLYPLVDADLVSKYRSGDRDDTVVFFARLSSAKGPQQAV